VKINPPGPDESGFAAIEHPRIEAATWNHEGQIAGPKETTMKTIALTIALTLASLSLASAKSPHHSHKAHAMTAKHGGKHHKKHAASAPLGFVWLRA
jgi:hypothetical protein